LTEDPSIKGNVWCGICQRSILKSGAKAHLSGAAHREMAQREMAAALHRTKKPS
jgi:hypothetical protein